MTDPNKAVFLSYASQDAEAARRICEALRAAAIEVWFDQSELRGGDAWDQQIRREIRDCTLFIPLISANTAARAEGYFRLEWSLAEARSHMIARNKAFIVPVCLDQTPESAADVPESFQRVQWTRLPGGNTPPAFAARIAALLGASTAASGSTTTSVTLPGEVRAAKPTSPIRLAAISLAILIVVGLAYVVFERFQSSPQIPANRPVAAVVPAAAVPAISEKSVAVLPFVDMSEKHDQEYFSDGLTEELIDHLAHSKELKVIARTSSFQFKGKNEDVRSIAAKLGVAILLEGSVRKSGDSVRITAQLIKAADGVHLWSQTYDRNLKDVFKIQDEIATTVARSLSVALSAGDASTRSTAVSSEAYNLVLEAKFHSDRFDAEDREKAVDLYKEAIKIEPSYARAWAGLGRAYFYQAIGLNHLSADLIKTVKQAKQAEERALSIDPDHFEAHLNLAFIYMFIDWDWSAAGAEIERCREIDSDGPGLRNAVAVYSALFGRLDEAIRLYRQELERDPLSTGVLNNLAGNLFAAGRFNESVSTYRKLLDLNPKSSGAQGGLAISLLYLGKRDEALATAKNDSDESARLKALSIIYWAMGRRTDSDAALSTLEGKFADDAPFNIASVRAYRGEADATFRWLDRAYNLHAGDMAFLKIRRQLLSLHDDPRYVALLKKMKLDDDGKTFQL
jgi:TolB-like protein